MMKLFALSFLLSATALAAPTANLKDGVMLYGFDPVSYFSQKPLKGKKEIKADADGGTYLFASEENKKTFLKNPKQYEPQYEGWCATAVAKGYKYDIDPENFKITNGRLFLFYKGWKGDAKTAWLENETENTSKADKNWPEVRNSKE